MLLDRFKYFLQNKLLSGLKESLRQGSSPEKLAISATIGLVLGIFPILGITTWVITLIAFRFRLNLPLMIAVSYLAWPLQVLLIIPFLRLGEWVWQVPPFPLTLEKIQSTWEAGFFTAVQELWSANLCAAGGWLAAGLPMGILLYFSLLPLFRYVSRLITPETVEVLD